MYTPTSTPTLTTLHRLATENSGGRSRRFVAASTLFASIGLSVAISLALGASPAAATNEFPGPNATLETSSSCDGSDLIYKFTLSNPGGFGTAHFFVDAADQSYSITNTIDVEPNATKPIELNIGQGHVGHVHVTSSDAKPAIDFSISLTNTCPPDETTTTAAPTTTTLPPVVTTIVDSGANLPETGSTSAGTIAAAFAALLAGFALICVARRAA